MFLKFLGLNRALILQFEKTTDFCQEPKYERIFFMLSGQKGYLLIIAR